MTFIVYDTFFHNTHHVCHVSRSMRAEHRTGSERQCGGRLDGHAGGICRVTLTDTDNNTIASAEVEDGRLEIHTAREGRFTVTIMLLGYRTYRSDTLDIRRGRTADLGTIRMEMEESSLEEVVVTRDRSKVVYRLDRRRIERLVGALGVGWHRSGCAQVNTLGAC